MGLFSKKNLDKAKQLAEKNASKIASGVDKATDAVNKKTGGKYADKLQKVDEAAHKYARQTDDVPASAAPDEPAGSPERSDPAT